MTTDTMLLAALEAIRVELAKTNHVLELIFRGMPSGKQLDHLNKQLKNIADVMPD